jgi:hypothetical protein
MQKGDVAGVLYLQFIVVVVVVVKDGCYNLVHPNVMK